MSEIPMPFEGLVEDEHLVWDQFIRVFHWGLVASVTVALVSGFLLDSSWIRLHLIAGSIAVALVSARIVWGFAGPTYARFSRFLPNPRQVIGHLRAHLRGEDSHARFIGHNPLGAAMVFALFAVIIGLGLSGVGSLGSGLKTGPLAAFLPAAQWEVWNEFHELVANVLLGLVILHVGGVVFESYRSHDNLARAMVTGRKEKRDGDLVAPPATAHPAVAALLISGLAVAAVVATNGLSQRPLTSSPVGSPASPVGSAAQTYRDECAACHMAYHPSTRPAASWQLMMGQLDTHFGEDASLPEKSRNEIAAWLSRNASETTDSKPATLWAGLHETSPVALPDTKVWQHIHASVDDDTFKRRQVYSRSNCAACHKDAETGWFSPFQISVPKEPTQ